MRNPDPRLATGPASGVLLWTRDGSRIGNAIILDVVEQDKGARIYVETDFGNRATFSVEELEEHFTYGFQCNYEEWSEDRKETRERYEA